MENLHIKRDDMGSVVGEAAVLILCSYFRSSMFKKLKRNRLVVPEACPMNILCPLTITQVACHSTGSQVILYEPSITHRCQKKKVTGQFVHLALASRW